MTKQVETATVVGPTTGAGNATVIITSAYMPNSPKTFSIALGGADSSNTIAATFRAALALDGDVTTAFVVSGATDKVILTDHYHRANDSTLNISIDNDDCTGITAALTSADTTAGDGLTNAYATLAEFKAFRTVRGGASSTDANDDTVIEDILELASRYIDGQTGRRFWCNTVDETRYYTPELPNRMYVDDLVEITTIKSDYGYDRTYSQTLSSTDYDLEPDNAATYSMPYTYLEIVPASSEYFATTRKGVQIVGVFGFPSVPYDIKEACLGIALNIYQSRSGQSSPGNITVTAAGVVIRPQDVPGWAQATINKYRRLF
jgi:hypothetical protein